MSSSSTNPRAYPNSLLARIDALERKVAQLSTASPGKIKGASATNSLQGFSWTGSTTVQTSAVITVPQFATSFNLIALLTSVVCSNSAAAVTAYSQLWGDLPEFGLSQSAGANVYVAPNNQAQRARAVVVSSQAIPDGMTTFQVRANGQATNTGANTDNALSVQAFVMFQY